MPNNPSDTLSYRHFIEQNLRKTKFVVLPLVFCCLALTGFIANFSLDKIKTSQQTEISNNLKTSAHGTHQSLVMMLTDLRQYIKRFQHDPILIELILQQQQIPTTNKIGLKHSRSLTELRQYFKKNDVFKNLGFFVINKNGVSIASLRDENIGSKNLIGIQKPELLKRVFQGETLLIPPIESDVSFGDALLNDRPTEKQSTLFIATPIVDNQKVIAVFTLRINTLHRFTQLLENTQFSPYSKTYIFNSQGHILNTTNHQHLTDSQNHIVNKTNINSNNLEKNINGVGVNVFRSWIWDDQLSLGISTEIPVKNAMASYFTTRKAVLSLYGLTILISLIAIITMIISQKRTCDLLTKVNSSLEYTVHEKTLAFSQAKEIAEQANNSKSSFLSNMSHELRTPLNAILGFTQLLQTDDNLKQEQKDSLGEISQAGKLLLNLLNDILDLNRIEIGQFSLHKDKYKINNIIEQSINLVRVLADKKHIKIELHNSVDKDMDITADSTRIMQILINLLTNAIKYNHDNGNVSIIAKQENDNLCIEVSDSGYGIPEDKLPLLFQPFQRFHAKKTEIEGTGIGLSIAKQLAESHNGSLTLLSSNKSGSTFQLIVPINTEEAILDSNEKLSQQKNVIPFTPRENQMSYILLIEDNPANIRLFEKLFQTQPFMDLTIETSAEEGLKTLHKQSFDLVLMDIQLPGMDGFAALSEIQAHKETKDIPVIAVTANAMLQDVEMGKTAGFVDYISKPLNIPSFLEVVSTALYEK